MLPDVRLKITNIETGEVTDVRIFEGDSLGMSPYMIELIDVKYREFPHGYPIKNQTTSAS